MAEEDILAILKFSAPVVGLISALWSLTQKITYEAEGGVKRLTLQGRVMIGILVTSTFISVLALGLEVVIRKQKEDLDAARQERVLEAQREKDRAAAAEKAQDRQDAAARHQQALFNQIRADSKEQSRFLEQRFVILDVAAQQQRRDAAISMRIAREANLRLSEAERAFAEFERINYPLRSIEVEVALSLDLNGLSSSDFWREMAELRDKQLNRQPHGPQNPIVDVSFSHFPSLTSTSMIRFDLVLPGAFPSPDTTGKDEIRLLRLPGHGIWDSKIERLIAFTLGLQSIKADVEKRQVIARFGSGKALDLEGVIESGEKLSLSDVRRLRSVLTVQAPSDVEGGRRLHELVGASISLNGVRRFEASSDLKIADMNYFLLQMRSARP